jgi:hypothetical protein
MNANTHYRNGKMVKKFAAPALLGLGLHGPALITTAASEDAPVAIISDQIRRQGFACTEPRRAERDRDASRPHQTVWILHCANATYRVTLVPDMAARVETVK